MGFPTVDQLLSAGEKMPPLAKVTMAKGESAKTVAFLCCWYLRGLSVMVA
jgi:hypothetical protein